MRAALIAAVLVAGTALLVGEAAMQPTAEERFTLYALIAAGALVAGCLCWWSTRTHRRSASLRWAILVVALTAVGLTAAVVGVSAATAFLALPDVRFVLGALTFGAGSGVLVTFGVTGPLTPDLRQVAQAAQHVADGDLSEVADGALDAVAPVAARRDVQVQLRAQTAVPTRGDTQALHRVLRNLLDNALRHGPPDSTVTVSVHGNDAEAVVRVADQGPGFPEGFAAHAFDRFTRPDTARDRHGDREGAGGGPRRRHRRRAGRTLRGRVPHPPARRVARARPHIRILTAHREPRDLRPALARQWTHEVGPNARGHPPRFAPCSCYPTDAQRRERSSTS